MTHNQYDFGQDKKSSRHAINTRQLPTEKVSAHVSTNLVLGHKEMPNKARNVPRQTQIQFEYEIINGELCYQGLTLQQILNPPKDRESNFPQVPDSVKKQLLEMQKILALDPDAKQIFIPSSIAMYPDQIEVTCTNTLALS